MFESGAGIQTSITLANAADEQPKTINTRRHSEQSEESSSLLPKT